MAQINKEFIVENTPPLGVDGLSRPDEMSPVKGKYSGEKTFIVDQSPGAISTYWITNLNSNGAVAVTEPMLTVGRSQACNLVLDDRKVSRLHAKITNKRGTIVVEDAGSENGIFINGHRIKRVVLVDGDLIQIGDQTLSFDLQKRQFTDDQIETMLASRNPEPPAGKALTRKILTTRKMLVGGAVAVIVLMVLSVAGFHLRTESPVIVPPAPIAHVEQSGGIERSENVIVQEAVDQDVTMVVEDGGQSIAAPVENTSHETSVVTLDDAIPQKPQAQIVYASAKVSRAQIEQAKVQYLRGEAENALASLEAILGSRTHRALFRKQAAVLATSVKMLYGRYSSGLEKYDAGDHDKAFVTWDSFVHAEHAAFGNEGSYYAKHVAELVAEKYLSLGNEAISRGNKRDAYAFWRSSVLVHPDGEAARRLDELRAEVVRLFNDAYRLETAELVAAKALWNEIISITPTDDEYHARSKAKLQWYVRWGR